MAENNFATRLSLNGEWDIEIGEHTGKVIVPGVWEAQGYPVDINRAIYEQQVHIPEAWHDKCVFLRFGGISYRVEVFVNEQPVGSHDGLWTAFEFDISDTLTYGVDNTFRLVIEKPSNDKDDLLGYRNVLVGFIPYISSTFGGPWKNIDLIVHDAPVWENVQISSDWQSKTLRVKAQTQTVETRHLSTLSIFSSTGESIYETALPLSESGNIDLTIDLPNAQEWSSESPLRYIMLLSLKVAGEIVSQVSRVFGFRSLATDGDQLLFNGNALHLRGILHWGWQPEVRAPIYTDDQVREEFQRIRAMGFNLVKLCLFVPTGNFFRIADEEGMLLWLEFPMWWQLMNPRLRQQLPIEYQAILDEVHHHPSIVLYSLGCELEAHMADVDLLSQLSEIVHMRTSNCLICDNSGSSEAYSGAIANLSDFYDYHFYSDLHQFTPLINHFHRDWRPARPWIFGEFCAYDDVRNPEQLVDADGARLGWRDLLGTDGGIHRWAYSKQEDRLQNLKLPFSIDELVHISRQQSWTIRKTILEKTRAHRQMAGYVICGFRDTPITTAGVWDDFAQPKYPPEKFKQINHETIILMQQGRRRIWEHGDQPYPLDNYNFLSQQSVILYIIISHVGEVISGGNLQWELRDANGDMYISGGQSDIDLKGDGIPTTAATIEWTFPTINTPQVWELRASFEGYNHNSWYLYLYPDDAVDAELAIHLDDPIGLFPTLKATVDSLRTSTSNSVWVTSRWSNTFEQFIRQGGKGIFVQSQSDGFPTQAVGFWQESLPLLYDHPIWQNFPHQGYVGTNFYHLATEFAFDSQALPTFLPDATIQPVMRRLHTRLFTVTDYMVEIEIGEGRLLNSTLRFQGGLGDQVRGFTANIAGRHLLNMMIKYLSDT